jgi:rod shape determining protein RodA
MFAAGGKTRLTPWSLPEKLWRINWLVVLVVAAIGAIGVAALYSVAQGSFEPWAERHALRLAIGIGALLIIAVTPVRFWLAIAYPVYIAAFVLLALVPVIGVTQMGARRWIGAGELSFQPSELMKIALVLALARYYQKLPRKQVSQPRCLILPVLMIAAPTALVMKQPDLGTAILFAAVGFGLMFLAGVNLIYFVAGAAAVGGLAPFLWSRLHGYQQNRILTFLDPDRDPLGAGYHILQSKIALGSGGLNGKGFMAGTQSQLNFLPEKHTDFIFTTFAEEMGFAGSALLLAAYAFLLFLIITMAFGVRDQFSRLLIAGATLVLSLYVVINIAMVTGLAPVVGVPLPLVSYGGTAMMTILTSIGLAMSAWVHRGEILDRSA